MKVDDAKVVNEVKGLKVVIVLLIAIQKHGSEIYIVVKQKLTVIVVVAAVVL